MEDDAMNPPDASLELETEAEDEDGEGVAAPADDEHEDDELDADGEPAAAAAPAPDSFALMEEMGRKLDTLNKHVYKRVGEIFGDDAMSLVQCELCTPTQIPGWRPAGVPPGDTEDAVLAVFGVVSEEDFEDDPHSMQCPECKGKARTRTHSEVPTEKLIGCAMCRGRGWIPTDEVRASGFGLTANGPQAPAPGAPGGDAALATSSVDDPPEVAALKAQGYAVIAPIR